MNNDVTLTRRDFGGCTILTVPGDVDSDRVDEIHASVDIADGRPVVLDLGHVSAVEPSAATALAALHSSLRARGGDVCFVTPEHEVRSQVAAATTDVSPEFFEEIGDALEASMAGRHVFDDQSPVPAAG